MAALLLRTPEERSRYREQWLADIDGAAELGLSPVRVALGAAGAAARISYTSTKGSTAMAPIGPLALALRLVGGTNGKRHAVVLTVLFGTLLVAGIGLLLARIP